MNDIQIGGYYPGVIGKITELHGVYYNENWGFDVTFETQVGGELSEFVGRFDENRDGLWVASKDKMFAGAIAIDGSDVSGAGARLRWFIVDPRLQGHGIGKDLISRAIAFCRKREFPRVFLWTFKGLEGARKLYETAGFQLCEESEIDQWGQTILEQKYELQISHNQ